MMPSMALGKEDKRKIFHAKIRFIFVGLIVGRLQTHLLVTATLVPRIVKPAIMASQHAY